jgi:hypothetical protein
MPRAGFEHPIPATKWPQTYALDRAATGIGFVLTFSFDKISTRLLYIENITVVRTGG